MESPIELAGSVLATALMKQGLLIWAQVSSFWKKVFFSSKSAEGIVNNKRGRHGALGKREACFYTSLAFTPPYATGKRTDCSVGNPKTVQGQRVAVR